MTPPPPSFPSTLGRGPGCSGVLEPAVISTRLWPCSSLKYRDGGGLAREQCRRQGTVLVKGEFHRIFVLIHGAVCRSRAYWQLRSRDSAVTPPLSNECLVQRTVPFGP